MRVKWVSQENPTSAEDALEKSIAKWRFFSYCTKKQLCKQGRLISHNCGLCHWNVDICRSNNYYETACDTCILSVKSEERNGALWCPPCFADARDILCNFGDGKAALAEFHAAARKVFAKLRSLRKS